MPGTNLTRDEAAERARLLDVTRLRRRARPHDRRQDLPDTTVVRFTATEPARPRSSTSSPATSSEVVLNGRDAAPSSEVV